MRRLQLNVTLEEIAEERYKGLTRLVPIRTHKHNRKRKNKRVRNGEKAIGNSPVPLFGNVRITTIFLSQTRERVSEQARERELLGAAGRYYVVSEPPVLLCS